MRFLTSPRARDVLIVGLLFALPLILFWQQTLGGRTLIPAENLYQYQPYAAYREAAGAPAVPYNHLVSDLVLQNYQWKSFIRDQFAVGEFPLWNPHQFGGIAFFAAGQQSTLYPFSILYYVLPLWLAYGWFTVFQLWLAGAFMYAFTRGLGVGRFGGVVAGVTFQLSAFFVISAVFPMIIAAAVWLPLILLMIEYLIIKPKYSLLWIAIGAVALGCNILAGHVEITYYTLLIAAFYAAARLIAVFISEKTNNITQRIFVSGAAMVFMVVIGLGIGAIQFLPLFEAASNNFRVDSASLSQVVAWAHPPRDVIQFLLPNFYGNPSHHQILDVFTLENTPMMVNALGDARFHTEWGLKNYVEGALYVGILPLILAVYSLIPRRRLAGRSRPAPTTLSQGDSTPFPEVGERSKTAHKLIFVVLGVLSLSFMFGLPTYILLYILPGIGQLHSPFRWVFALSLSVAVLAAFGADRLTHPSPNSERDVNMSRRFGYGLTVIGAVLIFGLIVSRVLYDQVTAGIIERVFNTMALATSGFPDARAFYSYQVINAAILGLVLIGSGVVFVTVARKAKNLTQTAVWQLLTVALIAADLMIASYSFNPASDPKLLDYTPPAITWLQNQPGEWRYTTLDDPTQPALFNANMTMRYGLDDIRGYESIIPRTTVELMESIAPQVQLEFNRIAPLYTVYPEGITFDYREALMSGRMDELNIRYVVTHTTTDLSDAPNYSLVYEDNAVRIWENGAALGRAWLDDRQPNRNITIISDTARELVVEVNSAQSAGLLISQRFDQGWRAYIRSEGEPESSERPVALSATVDSAGVQSVPLNDAGNYIIRLVYSPQSFFVGAALSFISGVIILLLVGAYLWRRFVTPNAAGGDQSGVGLIARNSLTPIILNLFNRGVDMAFALVMLRILGPSDAGLYYYAGVIFVWFDIFTNFGLNLYLIREVARDRSRAAYLFFNTSALRILLVGIGVPLLIGFIGIRQNAADPLPDYAVLSIVLLYFGLLPSSLSTGLSALFYAYERAEIPAATQTVATIIKTVGQLAALILGYGIVGLAAVSIGVNLVTLIVLWVNSPLRTQRREGANAQTVDRPLVRRMVGESYPLMLNHFLATIFFQIDVVLIEWIHNPTMVGQYSVAYKWVSALNVIPAFFTQALLPSMSRQAHADPAALKRTVTMALKLLISIALPIAVIFTFTSYWLAGLLGGIEYLPDGAIATQLMMWSIPIGWMNSLTQYVLIALDLQHRITRAFAAAVGFNLIANLIFIPSFGYQAAAIITILSELILLIAFSLLVRPKLGAIDWVSIAFKPVLAAAAMFAVLLLTFDGWGVVALVLAGGVYIGVWLILRPLTADELGRLAPILPGRVRRVLAINTA